MPIINKEKTVRVPAAHVCDICGSEDPDFCSDFVLRHTFGYGSPHDGVSVEAAICDTCLYELISKHIPGAKFTPPFGETP